MLMCQQSEGSLGSDSRPEAIQAKSDPRSWRRAIPVTARRFRRPRFRGDFSMSCACPRWRGSDIGEYPQYAHRHTSKLTLTKRHADYLACTAEVTQVADLIIAPPRSSTVLPVTGFAADARGEFWSVLIGSRSDPVGCKLADGHLSFNGTRRGPRTWPADQVTAPSSVKSGIRLSHSSSATFSSMRARLDPMQR